jgi:hypothetical protein
MNQLNDPRTRGDGLIVQLRDLTHGIGDALKGLIVLGSVYIIGKVSYDVYKYLKYWRPVIQQATTTHDELKLSVDDQPSKECHVYLDDDMDQLEKFSGDGLNTLIAEYDYNSEHMNMLVQAAVVEDGVVIQPRIVRSEEPGDYDLNDYQIDVDEYTAWREANGWMDNHFDEAVDIDDGGRDYSVHEKVPDPSKDKPERRWTRKRVNTRTYVVNQMKIEGTLDGRTGLEETLRKVALAALRNTDCDWRHYHSIVEDCMQQFCVISAKELRTNFILSNAVNPGWVTWLVSYVRGTATSDAVKKTVLH